MKQYDEMKKSLLSYKTKSVSPKSIVPLKGSPNKGINPETGERFRFESELDIERKQKYARINSNKKQNKFTNTNMDEIDYISENLTNAQIGYLMILQCYINYEGKLIHSQKDKTPLKSIEIQKILRIPERTFYDFKDVTLKAGILTYDKNVKTYSINKKFMFKGAFNGMNVVSIVTKEMKVGLNTSKPEELAMIFKLQKFVNFKTMALVKNPNETDLNKLEFLKQKDLAESLGVTASHLSRKLYQIVINGEYIIAKVKVGREPNKFMLNPNVFFRGNYAKIQENIVAEVSPFFKVKSKN
ncbi:hypothetical protein [Sutcliffiella horikoshii]|uniref:hypothetical protein n=1 Tax=Sutcliffiella horikoshii TaxID=79883 RepID=UPI001F31B47C|nr:hypothetical protein [Sutcliffiella horikoshii]MCG1020775.1 hypothetical protein [Sutcliffiella horikoshii]